MIFRVDEPIRTHLSPHTHVWNQTGVLCHTHDMGWASPDTATDRERSFAVEDTVSRFSGSQQRIPDIRHDAYKADHSPNPDTRPTCSSAHETASKSPLTAY